MTDKQELTALYQNVINAMEILKNSILAEKETEPTLVVTEPVAESVQEGVEEDPIVDAETTPTDRREVFKLTEGVWDVLEGGIKSLAPGDVFYLREHNGDVVADADGCQVFVATGLPYPTINENQVETTAIQVNADPRYTIETVGVSFKELTECA
jgi:hypothetical protein